MGVAFPPLPFRHKGIGDGGCIVKSYIPVGVFRLRRQTLNNLL